MHNYSILAWANIISGIVAFATIAVTVQILSVENYGLLVLIQAYSAIVAQISGFKTWEPLIKYGADAITSGDSASFEGIIRISFLIDLASAFIGWILLVISAILLSDYMKWNEDTLRYIFIYSLVIIFNISGFATGILRLYDRYKKLAVQQILFQLIRLFLILGCWYLSLGMLEVVVCWVISEILAYLILLIFGLTELKKNNIQLIGKVKKFESRRPFFSFLLANNIDSTIRSISREIDVIIIGLIVGKAGAGIYKLAVQISAMISKFIDPLYNVLLPIFSRLQAEAKNAELRSLVVKITTITFLVFAFAYFFIFLYGEYFIEIIFGDEYQDTYNVLLLYLIATGCLCLLVCVVPVMQAHGRAMTCMKAQAKSTFWYLIILLILCYYFGIYGAAIAYVTYFVLWFVFIRSEFIFVMRQ